MRGPIIYAAAIGTTAALALAGCGGSSGSGGSGSTAASANAASSGYGGGATTSSNAASSVASTATISVKRGSPGSYLVDGRGRTLYLWRADTGTRSTCSGACAKGWPPAIAKGRVTAAGGARAGLLGTTKRADGTRQITYAGHPLYRFAGDTGPGQTSGQGNTGFGAPWYAVSPGGRQITKG